MIFPAAKRLARRSLAAALAFLMLFLNTPPAARGQDDSDDDIDEIVARISYLQGEVSYARGDDPDEWDPALVNVPFALGDRIYSSAEGRAELQLPGGNFVRIGRRSYLNALTLTYDTKQFYLANGAATVTIRRLDSDEIFEIDTPNVAVTFEEPGRYRVEVDEDGNTRVIARRGTATVAANGRQVTVAQAEMRIYGMDAEQYETTGLSALDAFDRWVDERQSRFERSYADAYQYADEEIVGVEELAEYGRWEDIPEYGRAWTPTRVAVGWQPFTAGHWFWQDPWGWTWISDEPWGWAPCHYGRWTFHRSRWYWVPVRRRAVVVRYAPAVVEFVHVRTHVGWFPLHPRDRFVPWWGRRGGRVENFTYVNRTRVVVIDQETFVSARRVNTRIVRDTTIIREVTTVRVRESMPIPRRESIRVERDRRVQVARPPATIISRPVVVRAAPLPPPPRFDEKLRVIRERAGRPLPPEEMVSLGAKELKQRNVRIRPAAETRGEFKPRTSNAPPPQPVTPPKGRKLATPDSPVQTDLPRRQERRQERGERQIKEQQQTEQKRDEQKLQNQEKDQKRDERQRLEKEPDKQEQDRQKKQPEQDRRNQQKGIPDQQRKDQKGEEQERRQQERDKQEQERKQKLEEQQRQRQEKQLQQKQQKEQQQRDVEQRREQERKQQQDERDRQKQLQEQQRKDQQLQQQQQREEQLRREQERKQQQEQDRQQRLQEQERQKQLQEQQRQQQKSQKERERQEQDQGRQELERRQQPQQKQPETPRQKQLQEQRRLQKQREEEKRRQEQGGEAAPAPTAPTTPPR